MLLLGFKGFIMTSTVMSSYFSFQILVITTVLNNGISIVLDIKRACMEEINVEAECRNCNHAIDMHKPKCTVKYYDITEERICQCEKPQYFGVIISEQYIG